MLRSGSVPPVANHPQLTQLEFKTLVGLAEHGATQDLPGETRGRLALYKLIDETPAGWTITALGRQVVTIGVPVLSEESEKPPAAPKGKRHYGKKHRKSPWIG